MQDQNVVNKFKQYDSYSMLIVSKYFEKSQDFINIICVNSKFKETTEKLRFNPISVDSLKLFPKIQTQYLYSKNDSRIEGINIFEIFFGVDYDEYLKYKTDGIKRHNIIYSREHREKIESHAKIILKLKNTSDVSCDSINNNDICQLNLNGDDLTSISLMTKIKCIGKNCYMNSRINDINIQRVTSIGESCFRGCTLLKSVILSLYLRKLKHNTFYGCISLTKIGYSPELINSSQSLMKEYGKNCFKDCQSINEIMIPDSVSNIRNNCFKSCTSLIVITFPTSIKIIRSGVCKQCSSLTSVNLPFSITSIGEECFSGCTSLETVKLPEKIKFIGKECFSYCGLKDILIPSSVTRICNNILLECNSLTQVEFEKEMINRSWK